MYGDSKRRTKWVVVVTGNDGESRAYGPWLAWEKARAFAQKLIERDLDAQVARPEEPTIKAAVGFFGGL